MSGKHARKSWLSSASHSSLASSEGSDDGGSSSSSTASDPAALRTRLSSRLPEYALRARRRRDWVPPRWVTPLHTADRVFLVSYFVLYVAVWLALFGKDAYYARSKPQLPMRAPIPMPVLDSAIQDSLRALPQRSCSSGPSILIDADDGHVVPVANSYDRHRDEDASKQFHEQYSADSLLGEASHEKRTSNKEGNLLSSVTNSCGRRFDTNKAKTLRWQLQAASQSRAPLEDGSLLSSTRNVLHFPTCSGYCCVSKMELSGILDRPDHVSRDLRAAPRERHPSAETDWANRTATCRI